MTKLADALDREFLWSVLDEDVWYDQVKVIHPAEWRPIYDIEVDTSQVSSAECAHEIVASTKDTERAP